MFEEWIQALTKVIASARYVVEAEDAGYLGGLPVVRLREALAEYDRIAAL